MRKNIIAGNWKMFKTRGEAINFVLQVADKVPSQDLVESVICVQAPVLRDMVKRQGDNLRVGAQNVHFKDSGAFTGEVSAVLLAELGVTYVIIGHSERRAMFNETDETVNLKIKQALAYDLKPIVCVGESLDIREAGTTKEFVSAQVEKALEGVSESELEQIVFAYEPIWAIGTGKTATPEIAEETCRDIRNTIERLYSKDAAQKMRIQYGGSVKTSNIVELLAQEDIDGALIGGASLVPEDFVFMVNAGVQKN
ncbi:MAG: triose-phosphate isomerase [Gammaproteobacteria bacterium]|nr:triose-phosphate isomerase [Gammaproteobacteria bacterium]